MKVRWTQHSVRVRISPEELEALRCGEAVLEELVLSGGAWRAAVVPNSAGTQL